MTSALRIPHFDDLQPIIMSLPVGRALERADLLREEFRVHKDGNIEAYFMPSDGLNPAATLLLAGITPGWTQMELAYREVRRSIASAISRARSSTRCWSKNVRVVVSATEIISTSLDPHL